MLVKVYFYLKSDSFFWGGGNQKYEQVRLIQVWVMKGI